MNLSSTTLSLFVALSTSAILFLNTVQDRLSDPTPELLAQFETTAWRETLPGPSDEPDRTWLVIRADGQLLNAGSAAAFVSRDMICSMDREPLDSAHGSFFTLTTRDSTIFPVDESDDIQFFARLELLSNLNQSSSGNFWTPFYVQLEDGLLPILEYYGTTTFSCPVMHIDDELDPVITLNLPIQFDRHSDQRFLQHN